MWTESIARGDAWRCPWSSGAVHAGAAPLDPLLALDWREWMLRAGLGEWDAEQWEEELGGRPRRKWSPSGVLRSQESRSGQGPFQKASNAGLAGGYASCNEAGQQR